MDLIANIEERDKKLEELDVSVNALGPWSHSKVKTLTKCPFQFYLKYILKVKAVDAPISLVTEVGKAAHRILEHMIGGRGIDDAYKLTRKEYAAVLTEELWKEHVGTLEFSIGKFRERMDDFEKRHPVKRFIQELKIGVTREWEPTGFFADDVFYRSVIDLCIQLQSNDLIIIDHKTGAPALSGIRYHKDQLNVYKVMFHHGVEKVNGAQAGIHFIKDAEIILDDYAPKATIERKLVNDLELTLEGAVESVKQKGFFKHVASNICSYCEFAEPCKSGKLKDLEKKTVRFFKKEDIDKNGFQQFEG